MPCPCDAGMPCDQQSCEGANEAEKLGYCKVNNSPICNKEIHGECAEVCEYCEPFKKGLDLPPYHNCVCGLIGGNCDCPTQKG